MDTRPAAPAGNPLGTAPVKSLIWKFAIPGIISQLVNSLHNIVDQVFIGWGINDLGIAATNIVFPFTSIITALSVLIGMGAVAQFNILLGRKKEEEAADFLGNALTLMILFGVVITVLSLIFLRPILYLFGATDPIMEYAYPYARIIVLGLPFGIFATGMTYFVRGDGNPNFSTLILLSGAVFNMVFDPVFLFGLDLGIQGIALATVLGQMLSASLALYYLLKRFRSVSLERHSLKLKTAVVRTTFSLGFATFTTHILMIAAQIILMNSLRYYGALSPYGSETALAVSGAAGKLTIVLLSSIIGIALGCQPILGFNLGCRQYDRVKQTYLLALRYGTTIAVIAFTLLQLFPGPLLRIFGSDDPGFYEFGIHYIRIYMMALFLNALQPTTSTFCTAIGKAKLAFWMAVIRQGVLMIPLLLILPRFLGIDGILYSGCVSDALAAVVVIIIGRREVRALDSLQAEQASGGAA